MDDVAAWEEVEGQLALDLLNALDDDQDVLTQFIRDGGEPWDIYRIERAYLGSDLTTTEKARVSPRS